MLTNTLELIESLHELGKHIKTTLRQAQGDAGARGHGDSEASRFSRELVEPRAMPDAHSASWRTQGDPPLANPSPSLQLVIQSAFNSNRWFTEPNIKYALQSIVNAFLQKDKLQQWAASYSITEHKPLQAGIIMAGNIPLVSFHDLLCVLITGNKALIKLSTKDNILLPYLLNELFRINPKLKDKVEITERLNHADAIIATGSNNTGRYFEYYFARFPKIIRRNRGSVAVLTGEENEHDFVKLGVDIFRYFGLGCRNVSKLYVPAGYTFDKFFQGIDGYKDIQYHSKYKNNYDYNRTLLLMNKTPHLANDFLILKEDVAISSPVAELYYEYYSSPEDLKSKLSEQANNIQCTVGKGYIPFGETQNPSLTDYPDNVDTVKFLLGLDQDFQD